MSHRNRTSAFALTLGFVSAAIATATEIRTTIVSAAAFRPDGQGSFKNSVLVMGSDGYLYDGEADCCYEEAVARVELPPGAEINQICLFTKRTRPEFSDVFINLYASPLAIPGDPVPSPSNAAFLNNAGGVLGYRIDCNAFGSYGIVQPATDVNAGDGDEFVSWRLDAFVAANDGFGGVAIRWQPALSPPPAAPTFGDVATDHPFFPFVEPLGSSQITAGCGGGNYCPDEPITRGQMALLLGRALGLHWPD